MSYEILYDRLTVKVDNNRFLSLVISGSNNCYEITRSGGERRERNWCENFLIGNSLKERFQPMTKQTFEKYLDDFYKSYVDEVRHDIDDYPNSEEKAKEIAYNRIGYYSGISIYGKPDANFGTLKRWFKNSFKKAVTPNQLAEARHPLLLSVQKYSRDNGYETVYSQELSNDNILTELEKLQHYEYAKENLTVYIRPKGIFDEVALRNMRKVMFPKEISPNTCKEPLPKDYVIRFADIKSGSMYYYQKGLKRRLRCVYQRDKSFAHKFSLSNAKAKAKMLTKYWGYKYKIDIEKTEHPAEKSA